MPESAIICNTSYTICAFANSKGMYCRFGQNLTYCSSGIAFFNITLKMIKQARMALRKLLGTLLGRSWNVPGGSEAPLGRPRRACYSRCGMLQPPRHVTGNKIDEEVLQKQTELSILYKRYCISGISN